MAEPKDELARLAGRNGLIWRDYCAGMTQEALAHREGISQARISQIIAQVRESIPNEDREHEVQRSLELLHELRAGALEVYRMAPAPVFVGKDGVAAQDPETLEYVRDHTGRLRALETALKVDQRISTLLGLDAAQKLDMNVATGEARQAERLAEEAARRVAGEE